MSERRDEDEGTGLVAAVPKTIRKIDKPRPYRVLLHNDDFTTMEFVIYVLRAVFRHSEADATRIMLNVHRQGVGVAGIYSREIAETRAARVTVLARKAQYPLLCTIEPA